MQAVEDAAAIVVRELYVEPDLAAPLKSLDAGAQIDVVNEQDLLLVLQPDQKTLVADPDRILGKDGEDVPLVLLKAMVARRGPP